uniref:Vitellogenin domain-containing protein n=1 Tax=Salarias fasciatus TaxID=181472 RepID=A0A672JN78_SALFA
MRAVVLTLFLAFVAPHFNPNEIYEYKYETSLLSGLPEKGLARAGLKLRGKVLISAANEMYMLKLEDAEILEYSGNWPNSSYKRAEKLTSALAKELIFPIKFAYKARSCADHECVCH